MGERKNTSFLHPVNLFSTSSYFPANRLPLRYPWASFACRVMARGVGGLPLRCPLSTRGRFDPRVRHTRVIRSPISCSQEGRGRCLPAREVSMQMCPREESRIFVLHQQIADAYPQIPSFLLAKCRFICFFAKIIWLFEYFFVSLRPKLRVMCP